MNIGEVKAAVYQLLTMYFAGAVVVWANTKKVEPQYPCYSAYGIGNEDAASKYESD